MSEQIVDLRSVWAILRRHSRVLAIAAVAGGLAGGGALALLPHEYSSTTLVLFPPPTTGGQAPVPVHSIETQVQIVMSDAVLTRAGRTLDAPIGAAEVADRIAVETPTGEVLTITARGATASEAEQLATAVATADIDYLQVAASGLSSDQRAAMVDRKATLAESLDAVRRELAKTTDRLRGKDGTSAAKKADATTLSQLTAREADLALQIDALDGQAASQAATTQPTNVPKVVGAASPAQTQPVVVRGTLFVGVGAAAALLLAAAVVILRGRGEKALRSRDQIADSIGVAVVASLHSRTPRSVAGWVNLLRGYAPGSADAWALHQLLQRFTIESGTGTQPGPARRSRAQQEGQHQSTRLLVLTLEGDQSTLAVGPQIACFAAASGRQTRLVTSSHRHESTDSLRAACSRIGSDEQPRPGLLVDSLSDALGHGELVVHSIAVSRQRPATHIPRLDDAVTLLAVSSGGASAEDLARVALAADEAGVPLDGIVVANPDPLDRTTGRLLPAQRAVLAPLPSLMTGAPEPGEPGLSTALGKKR